MNDQDESTPYARRKGDADTPVTYSTDDAAAIRKMVTEGESPMCPRCHDELTILPPVIYRGSPVREVFCLTCRRCVMVRELAGGSPGSPAEARS